MLTTSNFTRRLGCVDISSPSSICSTRPKFVIKSYNKPSKFSINYSQVENVAFRRPKRFKVRRVNSGQKMDLLKKQKVPDYTDTAYKEAVSKLKYLLAESYTPRTPGRLHHDKNIYSRSTSRNRGLLNDIDLQSAVSDSISSPEKNHQQGTSIPADDSQLSSRELTTLIMRQEEYIEQLEQESRYCKDELKNLLGKIRHVVAENELLHDKNKMALLKGFLSEHDGSDDDNNDKKNKNDKKLLHKRSLKNSKLHDNLLLDSGSSTIMFESRISELEAQLTQCKIELKKALEDNDINSKRFSDKNGILNRENTETVDQVMREKRDLCSKLEEVSRNLQLTREREADAAQKAKNAIENRQKLEYEKSQVELEVRRLKDELERQRDKIREVGQESCRKLAEERHEVERRYGQQVEQLSADVATHWDVASKSQLEIEKQRREIFDLKRELGQKQAIIDDLKKELLSKISSLQNDLYQVTSAKDSFEQEVATAKLAVERSERHARQEQSRWQSEINSYKQRIERADADIVHGRRENLRLLEQIASLEKELSMAKMIRSTDTPSVIISTQPKTTENEMSGLIKNMEAKHAATVGGLENALSRQAMLVSRLTAECQILTQRLEANNHMHKEQMGNLQSNIEFLSTKIRETFAQQQKAQESYDSELEKPSLHTKNPSVSNTTQSSSFPVKNQQNSQEDNQNPEETQANYDQENNQNYENYPTEYGEQDYTQYEQYDPSMYQDHPQEITGDDAENDFHNSQYDNYPTNDYNIDHSQVPSQSVSQSDQQQYAES